MSDLLFSPILRDLRLRQIRPYVKKDHTVLDVGCGIEGKVIRSLSPYIKKGVGIDKKAIPFQEGNIVIQPQTFFNGSLQFDDQSFDCVTLLAVLEHLIHRQKTINEIYRILSPGGILLFTTPTWIGKPVLEFMAYRMRVLREEEIRDHKIYFWKKDMAAHLLEAGFKKEKIKIRYFELGCNLFGVAEK